MDNVGLASFSLSSGGVLAYRSGEMLGRRLAWVDRNGKETPALDETRDYADAWFSPDGTRMVFDVNEGDNSKGDLWIRDLARGVTSPLHVRTRARVRAGVVTGRAVDRLFQG